MSTTATKTVSSPALRSRREVRRWIDEKTGREVRQLTDLPHGARVGYFRFPRLLPGGWVVAWGKHEQGNMMLIQPESGEIRYVSHLCGGWSSKLRESDGRLFYFKTEWDQQANTYKSRTLWALDLPDGEPFQVGEIPPQVPGDPTDVACDGRTVVLVNTVQDLGEYPIPTTMDLRVMWRYFNRPRRANMWMCDVLSGRAWKMFESQGITPIHQDFSPADPTLLRYCLDMYDAYGQRIWTIRTDGSQQRPIRRQEFGELVTHEFWWSDPNLIGYTYQDRRGDPTLNTHPWAEYSPRPTRLGIADLEGREVYISDPINSYHSHLFRSNDGRYVCGEGTDGNSFAFAAGFDLRNPRIDMQAMATIHTPYVPFRGQGVETGFSPDSRWLLFNDQIDGHHQVCAVKVDF